MKLSISKMSAALAASSVLILTACGGGSGGGTTSGGGGGSGTPATAASTITSANAQDVSAQAYSAVDNLNGQVGTASMASQIPIAVETDTDSDGGLVSTTMRTLYKGLEAQPLANLVAGVTNSSTLACSGGGSISVSSTIAVSGKVSNGDSMTISASNCVEGGGKINGALSFAFSNMSGTVGSGTTWSATIALKFIDLTIETGGEKLLANGDMAVAFQQTGATKASYSVSGSSLQLALIKNGVTTSRTMSSFAYAGSVNGSAQSFSADFTLTGDFPKLGNTSYTVDTITPFTRNGTTYPSSGSMKVIATDKTNATLTAVDSLNVKIELDKDGNGITDETINTTWATLKSKL